MTAQRSTNEHNRLGTSLELKPAFREGGSITAGNAPGLTSGAAAMTLAGESRVPPVGRLVSYGVAVIKPAMFGRSPIPTVRRGNREAVQILVG
jgi:acetyl-CoA C-acetyltransferase